MTDDENQPESSSRETRLNAPCPTEDSPENLLGGGSSHYDLSGHGIYGGSIDRDPSFYNLPNTEIGFGTGEDELWNFLTNSESCSQIVENGTWFRG